MLYDELRAGLDALGLDVPARVLDRAAAAAVLEIEIGSVEPVLAMVSGAEWVTVKASADAGSETVGSVRRGVEVLVGLPEGSPAWRPLYGRPLGWVSANLVTASP